jgi:hypothetical protein
MTKFQNKERERERAKQAAHSKVEFGDGSDKNLLL